MALQNPCRDHPSYFSIRILRFVDLSSFTCWINPLPIVIRVASGVAPVMSTSIVQEFSTTFWGYSLGVTGLTLSMTVNALVTGLIVFKILKVSWEVKTTLEDQILDVSYRSGRFQRVIFVLIESGMALFSIQLARLVVTFVCVHDAYQWLIVSLHEMLNVIIISVIVYLIDNTALARELPLQSFWCRCHWGPLSRTKMLWRKLLRLCTLHWKVEVSMRRVETITQSNPS